ncbi:hypothetical protein AB0I68_33470 [Streptomyces sp. NPDC050448]|uniref:hypothetical protein n=1 Tax=Streptomyces sp. NPDC050448 TaxID=3155404 RepID=UPI00343FE326
MRTFTQLAITAASWTYINTPATVITAPTAMACRSPNTRPPGSPDHTAGRKRFPMT